MATPAAVLRRLLEAPGIRIMPCCYDALSARLVEMAGFPLTFMSGFAVSAARLALPDTGLISYGEMIDQGRAIAAAVRIPVIGDADTGYGNPMNVRRTVCGYAQAGFACVMIEDQLAPKRCGHTRGKQVVGRDEALARIRAAVDAREAGADVLVLARTDARATEGLDEAIWRARACVDLGADLVFVEAPRSEEEMQRVCAEVPAPQLANMVEGGDTPVLTPKRLEEIGYKIAAYPLTLLSASVRAMQDALRALEGGHTPERLVDFAELRELVGFSDYDATLGRYDGAGGEES
jgi:2-methylisocitrate lyase-like PEP mutase family enzyme